MSNFNFQIPLMVIGLLALFFVTVKVYLHKKRRNKQLIGIQYLINIRYFLAHVQQHRGLSNGYLNGSKNLLFEIEMLHQKLNSNISTINAISTEIENNDRWKSIVQHWSRLANGFHTNIVDNNLQQHNLLIQSILYLIDDMAQLHDLTPIRLNTGIPFHYAWRELLTAGEFVGQARAIGTGVAATQHCSVTDRIKLNYLCQKVEDNCQQLIGHNSSSKNDPISHLITCINQHLITGQITIDASEYFALASKALDSLLDEYDKIIADQAKKIAHS